MCSTNRTLPLLPARAANGVDMVGAWAVNRVYCADALTLLAGLPDNCIDLVVTSPPYDNLRTYNGYTFDFQPIARETYRVMKPGGVVVWVVGDATINGSETLTSMRQALYFVDVCGFRMHDTMIYEALGTGAKGSNLSYWQAFEYMFVLAKGDIYTTNLLYDRPNVTEGGVSKGRGTNKQGISKPTYTLTQKLGKRTNIWRYMPGFGSGDSTGHPAPFPEKLAVDHILTWSNAGDVVLDYFMGSGTTAKMARNLGRRYIGCDISQEYVDIANRRLAMPYTPLMFSDKELAG